ncbi:uncharacterized protein [Montipora capricornis]|uniref:uncharacterized protein n=1 Tax=Montipora foliosa TaxID=591990 RepID=UPI0035F212DB
MFRCTLLFMLAFTILHTVHLTLGDTEGEIWGGMLYPMMYFRALEFPLRMTTLKEDFQDLDSVTNVQLLLEVLFPRILKGFQSAARYDIRRRYVRDFQWLLWEETRALSRVSGLFTSDRLQNYYEDTMAKIVRKITERLVALKPRRKIYNNRLVGFPWKEICPTSPSAYQLEKEITITDICSSIQECSSTRFPYGSSSFDVTDACKSDGKCDVERAFPMMAGVYWHALNAFIVKRLCLDNCIGVLGDMSRCLDFETYERLQEELKILLAYTSAIPAYFNNWWNNFFQRAVASRAFSNLDTAMTMIEEKKTDFERTSHMCHFIEFTKACPYADIYKEFIFLKKVQGYRVNPGLVKDLRLHSRVNHKIMVGLQRDTLRHIELLGTIQLLDDNLRASVSGISSYFSSLASYDEGIANADVAFIQGELDKYETALRNVEQSLKDQFTTAMALMQATALANLVEEAALLVVKIIENCNPLRVIFGGSEPGDIIEKAADVANAASKVVRATALFDSLDRLQADSLLITVSFVGENSNRAQLSLIKSIVDKIRNNQAGDIGADAGKFLQDYAGYTPQVDRSRLAHNDALWSAFKDSTCEILNGDVGIAGSIPQSIAGGMLVCENLEGTLAQFFTLRDDIFDFQFQLIDSLAKVVRGNIAKRLAQNIEGQGDVLEASDLMIGFLMAQNRLQTQSSLYCDKLEYKQLGKHVEACSTVNGLFSKENVDFLIAYTDHSRFDSFHRDVYIPTKPRFQGDTGYIDLNSLSKGESVLFKLPADDEWLQNYQWILPGENAVPFVESFKIFLPHNHDNTGAEQQRITSRVTIKSVAGSAVSTLAPNTSPVYILPKGHTSYVTLYEVGYTSCTANEIENPYSLCENLPRICDKSSRQAGESLLPTILSTWKFKYQISKGAKILKWDAPTPATNLLIRAKLVIKMLPITRKRSHLPKPLKISMSRDEVLSTNGCCDEGNRYRRSLNDRICEVCPDRSTSRLRGLYCEIDEQEPQSGTE